MSKTLVLIDAAGLEGDAVLNALHKSSVVHDYTIFAVFGDPEAASKQCNKYPLIKPLQGGFDKPDAIFNSLGSAPHAVYFITEYGNDEVHQGKAVISAAVQAGTKHIVFHSGDRGAGGNVQSGVAAFDTKHEIEAFLRSQCDITYTIIRPSMLMDVFAPDFYGAMLATVWRDHLRGCKLKLVSVADVGALAARAMVGPEQYRNAEINLAGDNLTFKEASQIFWANTGWKTMPTESAFMTSLFVERVEKMKQMVTFLKDQGYGAEVQRDMIKWGTWVHQSAHNTSGES